MAAREVGADAAIAAGLPLDGTLEQASALRLFGLAASTQASGRLSLSLEGRTYALVFRRGAVEHAASSDPAEDLGRFLLRRGVLTPETLVQVESARAAAGGDLAGMLIAAGLVNPADVAGLLAEHGAALVGRALATEAGAFSWEPGVAPPPSSFPLGPPFAALCAAIRALDVSALKRRLGAREQRAASRIAGRVRVEDLRLTPQEARALGLFDGSRSPGELAVAQPAEAGVVLRIALLLGELDLLAFGPARATPSAPTAPSAPPGAPRPAATPMPAATRAPAAPPPPSRPPAGTAPVARPPEPARPSPRPPAPSAPGPASAPPRPATAQPAGPSALDPAALQAALEKQKGADHFQVLGVKRDAPVAAIKVAYFQLAKLYHPDAVPASLPAEVRALCADLFARVSEAWGVLGDDAQRAQYLEQLRSGGAADVDVMSILHAENVFQEGTMLVKARRYDEARAKFGEAQKLNPEEAEFAIWNAWCEFLVEADRKRQHAASAAVIEAALKKNPRCAPGYLFLGQMAKIMGDLALAEKRLKRGLQAVPDDADLVRELKYLRK